jgi:hypothetical protein
MAIFIWIVVVLMTEWQARQFYESRPSLVGITLPEGI